MLRIVIPTHRRVDRQITLRALPASLRENVVLVASDPAEADALRRQHKQVLVAPVDSIAKKRQWIVENVRDRYVLMLDDDMTFFGRCPVKAREYVDGRWKPKRAGAKGLSLDFAPEAALERLFSELEGELADFAHVGISSRLGNDMEPTERKIGPQRMMHAMGYDRQTLKRSKVRFDAVAFREDFHVTLELLKRGYPSLVSYAFCVSPGTYGAAGGCSDERTVSASDAAAERLAALHPGFVKVVEKDYKGTPRKEVVVQWKKAYESSQRG